METPLRFNRQDHPQVARLLDHCTALAGERELPLAADFRPADVRWAIGYISIIDVLDHGEDYRFRLFGSICQSVYGADLTGIKLSEIEHRGDFVGVRENYNEVVRGRRPVYTASRFIWANGNKLSFGRLLIPFADENGEVCRILAAADCGMPGEDAMMLRGLGLPTMLQNGYAKGSRTPVST